MEQTDYLGKEKIGKLLRKFAIPCILSLIISCLYNIVDQIFVGNSKVGYLGNAATGVIFPITVIGWGLSLFFGDGAAAWLSVSLGEGKSDKIHRGVGNAMLSTFISGGIVILIAYLWGDSLLMLLGGTEANVGLAHDYGIIIFAMMPLALVQNFLAAVIRADGAPGYAMIAMIVGAVLNIIGDPIAIYALDLGIQGAAWATIIGQFASFVICVCYLFRSKTFKIKLSSFVPDFKIMGRIMALGMSSFLTQLCIVATTIVNNVLFVNYGLMSEFGADIPLAAFVVIMKLFQIVLNIAIGIAAGAQPIVGYNYGAKQYGRVKQLLKLILLWSAGACLFFTVLFEAIPRAFIAMFGAGGGAEGLNAELYMQFAIPCLRIYLMFLVFTCVQKVCAIFMQSMGLAKIAAPLSFLRDILLIVCAFLVPLGLGVMGVAWAAPIADAIAIAATAPVMIWVWRKLGKLQNEELAQQSATEETTERQLAAEEFSAD
ncbi:MAG: MATE family efflux transporter [Eubacterium sp.]|nr:MATE family efflux transporter [Eubacterium sp.]